MRGRLIVTSSLIAAWCGRYEPAR